MKDLNADTMATGQRQPHSVPPILGKTADKGGEQRCKSRNPNIHPGVERRKPGGNTLRNVGKRTAEHSSSEDDGEPPAEAHAETYTGRGTGAAKVEWAEASRAHPKPQRTAEPRERPTRPTPSNTRIAEA